jgi:translation initiation factor 4E
MNIEQTHKDDYGNLQSEQVEDVYDDNKPHNTRTVWNFWYTNRKENDYATQYAKRTRKVASFNTLEDFFKYYVYIKSASDIQRNTDFGMFRDGYKPLWEACPNSACWFVRFRPFDNDLDLKWERLLFSLIGEQFGDLPVIGASLSARYKETIIELWFNYNQNEAIKTKVAKRMETLLIIHDDTVTLYFKDNSNSLKDLSTLKNAEMYDCSLQKRKYTYN